jgi:hypothetical protein
MEDPVSQAQLDADLATETTQLTAYINAVNAFIALPPVIDLANEDATVQAGIAAITAAIQQIPTAPSPKP